MLKSHASIDVLINAAGPSYVRNLGTMRITRAFLPMMKSDGRKKHIVNIASMGGGSPAEAPDFPYAASQEAFDRLSEALAENIRGTRVALTTVVPRLLRGRPSHDGPLVATEAQHSRAMIQSGSPQPSSKRSSRMNRAGRDQLY